MIAYGVCRVHLEGSSYGETKVQAMRSILVAQFLNSIGNRSRHQRGQQQIASAMRLAPHLREGSELLCF